VNEKKLEFVIGYVLKIRKWSFHRTFVKTKCSIEPKIMEKSFEFTYGRNLFQIGLLSLSVKDNKITNLYYAIINRVLIPEAAL